MSWYEVIDGPQLFQGDIIKGCQIPTVVGLNGELAEDQPLDVDVTVADVCVMTQTCDLENDKVTEVLLAQVIAWTEAAEAAAKDGNQFVKSKNFRKTLVDGNVPNATLLHKHEGEPPLAWSIVDFHRLFVLPKDALTTAAEASGSRLRLIPPYREHVGQAFARYFMRVGLPHEAKAFITEGG